MQLLAPAGNFDSLRAAVQNGADCVYLGSTSFSARERAENFADLDTAISYAHARGTQVHVTLNTIFTDREAPDFLRVAEKAAVAGADAFIVQDLGAVWLLRRTMPQVPLHASTQLSISNVDSARAFEDLGFACLVLARELPASQIRAIRESVSCQIEVFAHGAVCESYSGKCLMSSLLGGRSANRGGCAQPCRLPYTCGGKSGYLLNTKDLCLVGQVAELEAAGVDCLKIEGRLKGPLYVAAATRAYREALDTGRVSQEAMQALELTFSRGGFTTGRFSGDRRRLYAAQSGHTGMPAGKVLRVDKKAARICLGGGASLSKGDMVAPAGSTQPPRAVKSVEIGSTERCITLSSAHGFKPGQQVLKLTDAALFENLERSVSANARRTGLVADVSIRAGKPMRMHATLPDGRSVEVYGEIVHRAQKRALEEDSVRASLARTGDAPFRFESMHIDLEGGCFAPVSALNSMRRRCIEELTALLSQRREIGPVDPALLALPPRQRRKPRLLACLVATREQATAVGDIADILYVPRDLTRERFGRAETVLILPGEISGPELATLASKEQNAWLAGCLLFGWNSLEADSGLNTANSYALRQLAELGFERVTLSQELNTAQIRDLSVPDGVQTECVAYGYQTLMVSEHCPLDCAGPVCALEGRDAFLKDRTGRQLRVQKAGPECRVRILNAVPLHTADMLEEICCDILRLDFTSETPEECARIAIGYRRAMEGGDGMSAPAGFTRGHFHRGLV